MGQKVDFFPSIFFFFFNFINFKLNLGSNDQETRRIIPSMFHDVWLGKRHGNDRLSLKEMEEKKKKKKQPTAQRNKVNWRPEDTCSRMNPI